MLKFVLIGIAIIAISGFIIWNLWNAVLLRRKFFLQSENLLKKIAEYADASTKRKEARDGRKKSMIIAMTITTLLILITVLYFPIVRYIFVNKHEHVYVESVIGKATCIKEGVLQYKCRYCDEKYEESIPLIAHEYKEITRQEPTCAQEGSILYTCKMCNDTYTETIQVREHTYVETERIEPDCSNVGLIKYNCRVCDNEKTEEIPVNEKHQYAISSFTESSFWKIAYNNCVCELCGSQYYSLRVDAVNWFFLLAIIFIVGSIVVIIVIKRKCFWISGVVILISIAMLIFHKYVVYPHQAGGKKFYDSWADLFGAPVGCELIETNRIESSYTEGGTVTYICSDCDKEYIEYLPLKKIVLEQVGLYSEKQITEVTETINNGSVQGATKVPLFSRVTGKLSKKGDVADYYSFTLNVASNMRFKFSHDGSKYSYHWYATIYDTDGVTVLNEGYIASDEFGASNLNAGTYYLKISPIISTDSHKFSFSDANYYITFIPECVEHQSKTQYFSKVPTDTEPGELVTICDECGMILSTDKIIISSDSTIGVFVPGESVGPSVTPIPSLAWQRFERDDGYFYGYSDNLADGYVEYHYDSGNIYKGNFSNGNFDGYGEIILENGEIYRGNWKNGKKDGQGEYYWPNGNWYKGTFVLDDDNYMDGSGKFKRGDLIYEGTFTADKLNGAGKLYTSDSTLIYEGNFIEDSFNGQGTYYFPNSGGCFTYDTWSMGETEVMYLTTSEGGIAYAYGQWLHNDFYGMVYENNEWISTEIVGGIKSYSGDYSWMLYSVPGEPVSPSATPIPSPVWQRFERDNGYFYGYSDNLISGYVEYHYDSGDIYKGSYKDTDGDGFVEKTGEGEYITDNYTYKGNFSKNDFDGYGEIHWSNGDWYKGDWKDGERVGQGEYYWSDGNWYKGDWKNGEMDGQGEYHWSNGDWYKGDWKDGERVGQGEYYWSDGNWYKGDWKNGEMDGQGEYHWSSGDWYKGDWKDGVRVGQGKFKCGNLIYEGTFTADKLNGAGKLYTSDSTLIYEGNFIEDSFNGQGTYYFPNSGGCFTYDAWSMGETEVMYLTTSEGVIAYGQWLYNNFYGMVYENNEWISTEIVEGIKSYSGDYSWMLYN